MHQPKHFQAIMVSSTFTDLEEHRAKAIAAIQAARYLPRVMEHVGAQSDDDLISSSLKMVEEAAAYICVVSFKYGQIPLCERRNPNGLSITELEFNRAQELGLPTLLFIMGEDHPIKRKNIEQEQESIIKLNNFRNRAKIPLGSQVGRIYQTFQSIEQFSVMISNAVGGLARDLEARALSAAPETPAVLTLTELDEQLPRPPELAAQPRYLGSHEFLGRASELRTLDEWCAPADPNPMLLFEAMGGSGKSMLTWEWLVNHATRVRHDWAGRFWYSFYEKGAVMADFCRQALAYISSQPASDFAKLRPSELSDRLIAELERQPWLIVLDGLERILVAYHRYDAAQLPDEEVDTATDQIGNRGHCATIRPEDDRLLRRLAAASPSKVLISSRLTPLALVNPSNMPVPGVRRQLLPGLRPSDAEEMIRACGVRGDSKEIQAYLQTNCDCHPLVVGALAGLINDYPPDRGNFDRWASDPQGGGMLNLADLELVQRRNHILKSAIEALSPPARELLQTMALLQRGADFAILLALDSLHRAPDTPPSHAHQKALGATIRDLERRGLLQYDLNGQRYDLHPVVRGVVTGLMGMEDTEILGQRVVDYFTMTPHNPWDEAETLDDISTGIDVVRILLRMGRYEEACGAINRDDLFGSLIFNLNCYKEAQELLAPFFPNGLDGEIMDLQHGTMISVLNSMSIALCEDNAELSQKLMSRSIEASIKYFGPAQIDSSLNNIIWALGQSGNTSKAFSLSSLGIELHEITENEEGLFSLFIKKYTQCINHGMQEEAANVREKIEKIGFDWNRHTYRPGDIEYIDALSMFYTNRLTSDDLDRAEAIAKRGHNGVKVELLHALRGEWHLSRNEPERALESLTEGVRLARATGRNVEHLEALLTLAHLRSKARTDMVSEAENLRGANGLAALTVAEIWYELGDRDRAIDHALRAHRWAVGDGEPYVKRYRLDRARDFLQKLNIALPVVPRNDPSNDATYPWEADVRRFIARRKERGKREK